jgi:hypothetical protein
MKVEVSMSTDTRNRRFIKLAAGAIGAIALCALAVPLTAAKAQVPYLGVDFGGGFGIGIGVPPSAYGMPAASPIAPLYYPPPAAPPPARYYYYPY